MTTPRTKADGKDTPVRWWAEECPNCGRVRVIRHDPPTPHDGICDKCGWDADAGDYASITRPELFQEPKPDLPGPFDA